MEELRHVAKDIHYIDSRLNSYFRHKFEPGGKTIDCGFYWVRSLSNRLKVRFYSFA